MSAQGRISNKALKLGETLIKANGRPTSIYIVQSGKLIINIGRDGIVELCQSQAPQCLGEEILFGTQSLSASAIVVQPGQAIEVPVDLAKAQLAKVNSALSLILKGLSERVKATYADLKTIKASRGALPCPPDHTAKVFGVIFHTARYYGKKNGEIIEVAWEDFKSYAIVLMEEPEFRIRQALNILAKLGYAEQDIDGAGKLKFKDMTQIEAFFDFYQNYHFKSGYASLLKTHDKITAITQALLKVAAKYEPDRMGVVHMPFKATIDEMKELLGKSFEGDALFRLEQKGLMVKRVSTQDGGILSFWKAEFEQMLLNWRVLREVELWNERGYVDLTAQAPVKATASSSPAASSIEMSVAEKLAAWKPLIVRGQEPMIRTTPTKPGERLCDVCMSTVTKDQAVCEVCDTELQAA